MIWLIGNKGMLGTELSNYFDKNNIKYIGTDREVNILDYDQITSFCKESSIDWIINCAAYTAVDKAEDEEEIAFKLNVIGPENIAKVSYKNGSRIIHISTDYVFSGISSTPYSEEDKTDPLSVYGRTKAEGESRLLNTSQDSIILRTAWLYGKHGSNFVFTMLKLMKEKDALGVVSDQYGSPTWTYNLAEVIYNLINLNNPEAGIYHYTNEGVISWFDFANGIYRIGKEIEILTENCTINPIKTEQYPTKAKRPKYSVLNKEKIKRIGIKIPKWDESLKEFLNTLLI